jgi:hypothetical protein
MKIRMETQIGPKWRHFCLHIFIIPPFLFIYFGKGGEGAKVCLLYLLLLGWGCDLSAV